MKKSLIFIFLLSLAIKTFGQDTPDYKNYFKQVLYTYEYISNSEFDLALLKYKSIFNNYNFVFATDAFNACQLAAFRNSRDFDFFFQKACEAGLEYQILFNSNYISDKVVIDKLKYDSLYNNGNLKYYSKLNLIFRKEFIDRHNNEQLHKGDMDYEKICENNFNRILELTKKGEFPSEKSIGLIGDFQDLITPTLCHYPNSYLILEDYIPELIMKGQVKPLQIAYVYGFNQTRKSILYSAQTKNDTLRLKRSYNLPFGIYSENKIEVNRNRETILIYSIEVGKSLEQLNAKKGLRIELGY